MGDGGWCVCMYVDVEEGGRLGEVGEVRSSERL